MLTKIPLYTLEELEGLRTAGQFNAQLMDFIRPHVVPGAKTGELDRLVHEYTVDHGHTPACLGYRGFPKSCCISINEVVCHGIPGGDVLNEGDIVNVDLTSIVDGWYGDQSETIFVGQVSEAARQLVQVTYDSLFKGIRAIRPYGTVFDIASAICEYVEPFGYGVVREYQGHGIGRQFHQEPSVPHFPHASTQSITIEPGVCFTIEPMINAGTWRTVLDKSDGWTVRTRDGELTAQFEHTIYMTEDGPEILTLTTNGPQEGHQF